MEKKTRKNIKNIEQDRKENKEKQRKIGEKQRQRGIYRNNDRKAEKVVERERKI